MGAFESLSRRDCLRWALGAGAASATWRLWAAPVSQDMPRFLLVFLRGAYDSLGAVVPYADPFYYEARPRIAVAPPGQPDGCLALDGRWGLHPALQPSLGALWAKGELLLVPFSGTAFVSRSHFQAQDWMEMAGPASAGYAAPTGFMNRLLQSLGAGPEAVALTANLPLAMRGPAVVNNAPVSSGRNAPTRPMVMQQQEALMQLYNEHALAPMWTKGLGLENELRMAAGALAQESMQGLGMDPASRQAILPGTFELQAARVAQLLKEQPQYRLGMLDVGGWDTHANQGGATGTLAGRLKALGQGLVTLATQLGPKEWRNTVVVVLSEFGRTFRENGTRGTDHGHGSTLWMLGGAVKGGRIWGDQADLTSASLHQNRDVPVLNEYRAVLAELLRRMYGLDSSRLAQVFADVTPAKGDWL